jgi:hypothetical protein
MYCGPGEREAARFIWMATISSSVKPLSWREAVQDGGNPPYLI